MIGTLRALNTRTLWGRRSSCKGRESPCKENPEILLYYARPGFIVFKSLRHIIEGKSQVINASSEEQRAKKLSASMATRREMWRP